MNKKPWKTRYRIRNWRQYNAALVNRGSLTFWFDESAIQNWEVHEKTGNRGASQTFSDKSIQCALTLKHVYHLPLRATEGFLSSLLELMKLSISSPDYTTICRRRQELGVQMTRSRMTGSIHIVVDSTGLKVYGEGEWKVRQHGYSKRRTWRKLHLAVDESTHEIVAVLMTSNDVGDSEVLPCLLDQFKEPIDQLSADGAYDTKKCHRVIMNRKAKATIPPCKNAKPWKNGSRGSSHPRNQILDEIKTKGRKEWKEGSGYHRRSLSETAMFRYKTIIGDKLTSRTPDSQSVETHIGCNILNKIVSLGMPQSHRITT
jgi:hypothetical protein